VPRAYDVLEPTKKWKGETHKNKEMKKYENLIQNKIQDFKNTFF
jgi:hypothetical protein